MFWFSVLVVFSFVPLPPPWSLLKIAFVFAFRPVFPAANAAEGWRAGSLGRESWAHLGLELVSGVDLMLRYNNVAGPGLPGVGRVFWAGECGCECAGWARACSFLGEPGGTQCLQFLSLWSPEPSPCSAVPVAGSKDDLRSIASGAGMCGFGWGGHTGNKV